MQETVIKSTFIQNSCSSSDATHRIDHLTKHHSLSSEYKFISSRNHEVSRRSEDPLHLLLSFHRVSLQKKEYTLFYKPFQLQHQRLKHKISNIRHTKVKK